MDDRYLTQPFRYSYNLVADAGGITNAWYRFDHHSMQVERFSAGSSHALHEPQFVPPRHELRFMQRVG